MPVPLYLMEVCIAVYNPVKKVKSVNSLIHLDTEERPSAASSD